MLHAVKACRGSRGITLLIHNFGARGGGGGGLWVVNATARPLHLRKYPVPIMLEVGWVSRQVWTGKQNLPLPGIRIADRPSRSGSTEISIANINNRMSFLLCLCGFLILLLIVPTVQHQIIRQLVM
jgi:hypothetical protein